MEIDLFYRDYLIQKIESGRGLFYEEEIQCYLESLDFYHYDYYEGIKLLRSLDKEVYCGIGVSNSARYSLYNHVDGLIWFKSYYDAMMFLGIENAATNIFNIYRQHWYNNWLCLLPEDLPHLGEYAFNRSGVYCETKGFGFESIDSAARWLVDSGNATNINIAKKQLEKHLNGQTTLCYKMKFIYY